MLQPFKVWDKCYQCDTDSMISASLIWYSASFLSYPNIFSGSHKVTCFCSWFTNKGVSQSILATVSIFSQQTLCYCTLFLMRELSLEEATNCIPPFLAVSNISSSCQLFEKIKQRDPSCDSRPAAFVWLVAGSALIVIQKTNLNLVIVILAFRLTRCCRHYSCRQVNKGVITELIMYARS